jgi:EmrB/QacA subfamily drug resistance transporter
MVGTTGNSMFNVALPSILEHYDIGLSTGVWVITIYVLLFSTLMPVFGKLGDMFGYKRIYLFGMVGLVLASIAGAFAPSIGWMIGFRALAGVFNAPTLPAIMAIIAEVFPAEERGGALGFWATVNGAGHGFGPVISGLLVQYLGWESVFWFNAALALIGVVMITFVVPSDSKRTSKRFDFLGAVTLTAGMIMVMFNLTQGLDNIYGRDVIITLWVVCGALFALFLVSQSRIQQPFVDLKLFRNPGYAVVTFVSATQLFCLFGMQLLLPLFLINVQGRTSGNAGLLIAPLAISLAVVSPLAGRLSDKVGSRVTCLLGMGTVAVGGLVLTLWTAQTPTAIIMAVLTLIGIGMGMTQSPTANAVTLVMGKEQLGVALGIFNMLRFVSGTLGATIFGAILARGGGMTANVGAFRLDFIIFAAVAGTAALLALRMPSAPRRLAPQRIEANAGLAGD